MQSLLVLFGLLLFILYASSTFDYFSPELNKDYFFPRSGDLLIFSNDQAQPFRARIVSSNVGRANYALKEKFIDDSSVADYFAHINGLGVVNEKANREGFPSVPYFEKPQAQLIFVLDDIDQAEKLELVGQGESFEVTTVTSKLSTPLSFLTTLFSGSSVSEHGIIDEKWWDNIFGTYVTAYSRDDTTKVSGEAFKANLASLFSWTTKGQSLVLTYGGDYAFGATMAPHSKILNSLSNVYSAFYVHDKQTIGSIHGRTEVPSWMKETEILSIERLRNVFSDSKFSFSQKDNQITVTLDNTIQAFFDLNSKNDAEFIGQFNIIDALFSSIKTERSDLLSDNIPDIYSFYLTGLKSCKGDEDKKRVIVELLNTFTLGFSSKLNQVYSPNTPISTHAVLVEAHSHCPMQMKQRSEIAQLLRAELGSQLSNEDDLEATLPHVYLLPSLSVPQINMVFFQLEAVLKSTQFRVASPSDPLMNTFQDRSDSNSTSSDDDSDTVVLQTALWSSIALAVAVLMAVYFIVCMDTGQDTIIYRPVPHMHKA